MAPKLFILIPPSEGKAAGGSKEHQEGTFDEVLAVPRQKVLKALKEALRSSSPKELEKILGVRGPLLERAVEATSELVRGKAGLLPAYQRYSGVVWTHLDPATLSKSQRKHILIPSGVYGITTGQDLIGDYRLKMDVSVKDVGNVAKFWKPYLSQELAEFVKKSTVVNLLPSEHAKAVDFAYLETVAEVVNIEFTTADGSGAAGHDAKAVKGVVGRLVLTQGLEALADFSWNGWHSLRSSQSWKITAPKK